MLSLTAEQARVLPEPGPGVRLVTRVAADPSVRATATHVNSRGRFGLHVVGIPAAADPLLAVPFDLLIIEPDAASREIEGMAFELKRVLVDARGRHASARLLVAASAALVAQLVSRGLQPYVDAFVDPPAPIATPADLFEPLPADSTRVRQLPDDVSSARAILDAAVATTSWFPKGLVPALERPLLCAGGPPIRAYLNPRTLDLVGASRACPPPATVTGDVAGVMAERIDVGDLSVFRVPVGTSGDRFAEDVTVGAARALTVEEIVARHQAAAARQAAGILNEIATGTFTLAFEAPGFVAPVTITAQATILRDRLRTDIRHADVRVNGVRFTATDGVPRLPIIEPERVAAVPLTITLTSVYRYELEGRETVEGHPSYVIAFAPRSGPADDVDGVPESLYRGRVWIDERRFAMVRVSAAQTGLTGPIIASEQTDTYAPDAEGRWLLTRSEINQTYEGASVRTPIHRVLALDRHEINPVDFEARRASAYASTDVILRDTPAGFRYLRRAGSRELAAGSREPAAGSRELEAGSVIRVVAPPVSRVRTIAAGVIVDPNITTPLPFAGLSYVDFDLFRTGTQFSGFFGGSYAQAAFSTRPIGGTRWRLNGRAFAIATSYNDRAFVDGHEVYAHDIHQRPAQVAVWALRPIGTRTAIRLEYNWDYNRFARGEATDPAFVVPRNQNAHGLRAGIDLQHAGWQMSLWASHTIRVGWRGWGIPGAEEYTAPQATFQRYGASVLRTVALSPRVTARLDGSIVGGQNLDRFSRISFGTFDNRLHGYPSALIRYDKGAVVRSAVSWTAARAVRVDGFGDFAAVHDPGFGRGLHGYAGFGAAIECPAPFGTLLAAEWGYGVQGINTNGRAGTHVVRITGYKVF